MKRARDVRVGSARILRALAGILPDGIKDKPRVELARAWKAYQTGKLPGRMAAETDWKSARERTRT
jgi:hypothetical protein